MRLNVIGLSLAAAGAASFAVLLQAAAAPAATGLSVDVTAPADHSRVAWQLQAPYSVTVSYAGKSTKFGEIPSNSVVLRAAYAANADAAPAAALPDGVAEISRSNCTGCHDFTSNSAGPSFAAIGKRYAGKSSAVAMLADHIRNGSHGAWGGGSMPPHPDMNAAQATAIAQWLVGQGADPAVQYSIGKSGSFRMAAPGTPGPHSGMVLSAYYTGPLKPGDSRSPTSGRSRVVVYGAAR